MKQLLEIMAKLRDKESGCPWDIEQNFASIAKHTIEEAYEVVDAIETGDMNHLKEELGDLLLQVVFHSQMAKEAGSFNFDDVVTNLNEKLIRRHPHVFADSKISSAKEQELAWDKHKELEQKSKPQQSILDGVALALPALMRAVKLQKKAAKVGFDWPSLDEVFAKIEEEIAELKHEIHQSHTENITAELGDIIFAVTNLARKLNIDPESALSQTNTKFLRRFKHIETRLKQQGKDFPDSNLAELDSFWNEAKLAERG